MKHAVIKYLSLILVTIILSGCASSKSSSSSINNSSGTTLNRNERYVQKYHPLAVEQMEMYGIPASITLAQGILESGAGESALCRKSNNHFCIKADKRWKGRKVKAPDRGGDFYFRVYDNAEESYEDHSLFLASNGRYASLFKLNKTDYKGWARGLKKAGYAEARDYDKRLINLIERYALHEYDKTSTKDVKNAAKKEVQTTKAITGGKRELYKSSGLLYVFAKEGDTWKSLAKEVGISWRKLVEYNDLYKDYMLREGDIIYLEKKNTKAKKPYEFHTVAGGESLYSISQRYGIRIKNLYKMNPQYKSGAKIKAGDVLRLR